MPLKLTKEEKELVRRIAEATKTREITWESLEGEEVLGEEVKGFTTTIGEIVLKIVYSYRYDYCLEVSKDDKTVWWSERIGLGPAWGGLFMRPIPTLWEEIQNAGGFRQQTASEDDRGQIVDELSGAVLAS